MAATASIQALASHLTDQLRRAYIGQNDQGLGAQPLRDAFDQFGRDAAAAGVPLEEAISGGVVALQELFERVGGQSADPSTMIAAGIALAALARSFEHPASTAGEQDSAETVLPTQVARLAALHRINRAATANLKLSEMLETVARVVAETTNSDACCVMLYDAATDSLALRAAVGLNSASIGALTIRPGMGITGRAAAEGRPIIAPDAHLHEANISIPSIGDDVYRTQVSVPMLIRGANRLVGVLNIFSVERRTFDDNEIAFLQTVAGELAISIENARLYSRTDARLQRKVAELGTLQRVSRFVASSLDLPEVLRSIAEAAVELINAEAAAIFRLHDMPNGTAEAAEPTIEYRVGSLRQHLDESRRNDLVREVIHSGSAQATEVDYVGGARRLFCMPLRSARKPLGALCLRLRPGAELTEDELGLLQAFTDSASIAIENAQLYQEALHGFETTTALLQEMHHRVRNNLQTVAALLSIQIRQDETAPSATHLREAVSRIQAIASVHDLLSDQDRLAGTTIDTIARLVADEAHTTLIPPGLRVSFEILPSDVAVSSKQATILALLTNELVSNAVSHGFRGRAQGHIVIRTRKDGDMVTLEVENDGERIPEGFNPIESRGLGMRIVQRLVTSDLRGAFSIQASDEGTVASIRFPLSAGIDVVDHDDTHSSPRTSTQT
jgi:two-component sensor histidine kinase/putative methionine-R-sulfoxide reductase with GAF domain